jgi:hypothetical protein
VHSKHALEDVVVEYGEDTLNDLFYKVRYGHKQSCYWIAIEPFRFFMDIDSITREQMKIYTNELKNRFDNFLVCKSSSTVAEKSYSVFTDKIVTYKDAIRIESELVQSGMKLDKIIFGSSGKAYRRSPYSLHGISRNRILLPDLSMSKINLTEELDLFRFSYCNVWTMKS